MEDRVAHFVDGQWRLGETLSSIAPPAAHWLPGWWPYAAVLLGAAVMLLVVLPSCVGMADQWDRAVLFRFGRFVGLRGPGLFFKNPFTDKVVEYVGLRTRTSNLKAEKALTRDTVAVAVETVVFWHVIDAEKAALSVEDYEDAILQAALTCLREMIGATDLSSLLSDRETADRKLREAISRRAEAWGIEVVSVDIKDVAIPEDLYDVMSRQAQAERERDARITLASAEVGIAQKTIEAARLYDEVPTALKLRQMSLVYEMGQNSNTILVPTEMVSSLAGGVLGTARTGT